MTIKSLSGTEFGTEFSSDFALNGVLKDMGFTKPPSYSSGLHGFPVLPLFQRFYPWHVAHFLGFARIVRLGS